MVQHTTLWAVGAMDAPDAPQRQAQIERAEEEEEAVAEGPYCTPLYGVPLDAFVEEEEVVEEEAKEGTDQGLRRPQFDPAEEGPGTPGFSPHGHPQSD